LPKIIDKYLMDTGWLFQYRDTLSACPGCSPAGETRCRFCTLCRGLVTGLVKRLASSIMAAFAHQPNSEKPMPATPPSHTMFDIAIIGAGVVGCALARRLVLDGARVVVLEKAAELLDGASKANSAILHTGFDAPPGSLEQKCVAAGYREYLEIRESLGLPLLQSGAMVLAWNEAELAALDSLIDKARQNGVADVSRLSRAQILAREPQLSAGVKGGFLVPGEFLIDPWSSAHSYILQALANGAEIRRNTEVLSGRLKGEHWVLETSQGAVCAAQVISCAGLYGDIVDARLLGRAMFRINPRKGQFVVFDKPAAALVKSIILPVPSKTTKGVVICRTIFGNLLVGPTAEEQESRTDAATEAATLADLREKGIKMLPALANCEVAASYAGLRPATEYSDFQITRHGAQNYISVGGIRSTGLSAALGIARHVAALLPATAFRKAPVEHPAMVPATRLSAYHPRDWEAAGHGGIICHCELVTKREIEAALAGPLPPTTLQGLKRRTRVGMGRCQGFYCTAALAALTKGRLVPPIGEEGA